MLRYYFFMLLLPYYIISYYTLIIFIISSSLIYFYLHTLLRFPSWKLMSCVCVLSVILCCCYCSFFSLFILTLFYYYQLYVLSSFSYPVIIFVLHYYDFLQVRAKLEIYIKCLILSSVLLLLPLLLSY